MFNLNDPNNFGLTLGIVFLIIALVIAIIPGEKNH